jgi:phosphoribosylformylglycinamidine synthase
MAQVRVLVLTGYGTNCDRETAYTARQAGADEVVVAHFADLVQEKVRLSDFNFLVFPGGFLDGDHLGGAQAAAVRYTFTTTVSGQSLIQGLRDLHANGGVILGICNGFQLLAKLGLLPGLDSSAQRQVSLSHNNSARFEDRWVHLSINPNSPCIFTAGLDRMYLPVRHGEGKIILSDESVLNAIQERNLIVMQYTDQEGVVTDAYPDNPNGSPLGIAGLCDPTGRIFGLMPHPEAYNHPTNHPAWTRGMQSVLGTTLFERGVAHLRSA